MTRTSDSCNLETRSNLRGKTPLSPAQHNVEKLGRRRHRRNVLPCCLHRGRLVTVGRRDDCDVLDGRGGEEGVRGDIGGGAERGKEERGKKGQRSNSVPTTETTTTTTTTMNVFVMRVSEAASLHFALPADFFAPDLDLIEKASDYPLPPSPPLAIFCRLPLQFAVCTRPSVPYSTTAHFAPRPDPPPRGLAKTLDP